MNALKHLAIVAALGSSLCMLAVESPFSPDAVIPTNDGFSGITTTQAETLYKSHQAIFVDARNDLGLSIPGSIWLNVNSTDKEIAAGLPDKSVKIVTYADDSSSNAESLMAAHLKQLGYTNVVEYPAGLQGWINAGNPGQE